MQFHEGQEVEVLCGIVQGYAELRKGKIVTDDIIPDGGFCNVFMVQFTDGTRGVFDAEKIRQTTDG
jgi:hypothetical protein